MKEKKNIERLFQEKFKDFEAVPPPKIWNNIEAELQKKKRRKAIPIWFKLSGAAAVLIISFLIRYGLLPSRTDESTDIVKQDNNVPENRKNQVIIKNHIKNDEAVADAGQPEKEKTRNPDAGLEEENTLESEKNQVLKNKQKETAIAGEETKNAKASSLAKKDLKKKEETIFTNNAANRNTRIAISQKAQKGKKLNKYRKNNAVAISEKDDALEAHLVKEKNKSKEYKKENSSQNTAIADKDIAAPPVKEKTPTVPDAKALEKQKDSAAVAAAGPNALEELLKEKEQQTVREPKVNRWQIMPSVAPIYFSSVSGGSPIDPQLADNSKNYKKSMSYGISIEYALAKKWSVRTGVNKITLGYNTNDIIYYASLDKARIADSNQTEGSSLVVEDNTAANLLSFDNVPGKRSGYLNQKMGYIEVPVEVSYKILDRRFGIEAIGGMSAMFLNENRLSVISGGISASAGEASNLNSISFTSNIGLGFRYRFWKTFQANVEPKFKYQINTFSENAGGFKPYFIGIYSGISFSF